MIFSSLWKAGGRVAGRAHVRHASSANLGRVLGQYPVGLQIHGYAVEQVQPIPEFSLVAVRLKHLRTGLEHLHLHADADTNNVFSIGFKTNATDATGVPHILEHTTLCGSYKYPIRDPFFKMLNRSLANFMNAMTGHDYTFYPFATTNSKDFDNLMDVYLLSTLEPLLTHQDLMQEGWRLEHEAPDKDDLTFKGVVYNEMKGQYSNSGYYFYIKFQEAVYPSLHNSGGDPRHVTDLQYEDLIDFHALNYHPLNSRTFTYGAMPLFPHLEKINGWFSQFGKRSVAKRVRKPIFETAAATALTEVSVEGPHDSMSGKPLEEQFKLSITWSLGDALDERNQYLIFKWKVLLLLLCDGHNAPLYQELIESRYGDDFTPNLGLDVTTALYLFSVGLENLTQHKASELEDKVRQVLQSKVVPQLAPGAAGNFGERVEAILHQIEINFKKHRADFGLGLLSLVLPSWVNGYDPVRALQVEHIIAEFKEEYAAHGVAMFEGMVGQLLSPDTARLKFTMTPLALFEAALEADERERLAAKTAGLDAADHRIIRERSADLLAKQQAEQDALVLPTLTMGDIPAQGELHELEQSVTAAGAIQKRIVDANGLSYMAAKKDILFLPEALLEYLPLFTACLTNLAGTTETAITDLETRILLQTGGILFHTQVTTDPHDLMGTRLHLVMDGLALTPKLQHVYQLWFEVLLGTRFDADSAVLEKLATLVKNMGLNQLNTIADRGNVYASLYSNLQLTPAKYIGDLKSGVRQIEFVKRANEQLAARGDQYLAEELLPRLRQIQQLVVSGVAASAPGLGFEYSLLGDAKSVKLNEELVGGVVQTKYLAGVTASPKASELGQIELRFSPTVAGSRSFIDLPFQIGFASSARLGLAYMTKDGAALQVLSQLVTNKHLHLIIREANGAYGGGLNYDGLGGTLNYYLYRDPNPIKSIASFADVQRVLLPKIDQQWGDQELQEAKLSIFQSVDAPANISLQGSAQFLRGITDAMKQQRRQWFLAVTKADLKDVAAKYLVGGEDVVTVIGKREGELAEWQRKEL